MSTYRLNGHDDWQDCLPWTPMSAEVHQIDSPIRKSSCKSSWFCFMHCASIVKTMSYYALLPTQNHGRVLEGVDSSHIRNFQRRNLRVNNIRTLTFPLFFPSISFSFSLILCTFRVALSDWSIISWISIYLHICVHIWWFTVHTTAKKRLKRYWKYCAVSVAKRRYCSTDDYLGGKKQLEASWIN